MRLSEAIAIIAKLTRREINRITARPIYAFCMIIAPLFSTFFLLSLMGQGLPSKLPLAMVDEDDSPVSRSLIRNLDAFEQSNIVLRDRSFNEARLAMQRGDVYGIFHIPRNFEADLYKNEQPQLTLYTNNAYLMAGTLLFRDMRTIAELASAKVGLQYGQARGQNEALIISEIQPLQLKTHLMGNPWLNYSVYLNNMLIPGILQLFIFLVTVYAIGTEVKYNTSRDWLSLSNGGIVLALLGKLLVYTLVFFAVGMACLSLMYGFYAFPLNCGWTPIVIALLLLILASQALGILFISLLPTLRLGLSAASLMGMLAFSMTGFSYPVGAMYAPFRTLTYIFPLRYYYLIYSDQALNGRPLQSSWIVYVGLAAFVILPLLNLRNLKYSLLKIRYKP